MIGNFLKHNKLIIIIFLEELISDKFGKTD